MYGGGCSAVNPGTVERNKCPGKPYVPVEPEVWAGQQGHQGGGRAAHPHASTMNRQTGLRGLGVEEGVSIGTDPHPMMGKRRGSTEPSVQADLEPDRRPGYWKDCLKEDRPVTRNTCGTEPQVPHEARQVQTPKRHEKGGPSSHKSRTEEVVNENGEEDMKGVRPPVTGYAESREEPKRKVAEEGRTKVGVTTASFQPDQRKKKTGRRICRHQTNKRRRGQRTGSTDK